MTRSNRRSDKSDETEYDRSFRRRAAERLSDARARQAAEAVVDWLSYPEAVHAVLPVLFGRDWVGLASEQEKVVLTIGEAHPDWRRYRLVDVEREEQIARAKRWLLMHGLLERDRHEVPRIRAALLQAALVEEAGLSDAGDAVPYRTGLPGKPTSWRLIEAECRRRYAAGERHPGPQGESRTEWARILGRWLGTAHPLAPAVTVKTLIARLGPLLRELQSAG